MQFAKTKFQLLKLYLPLILTGKFNELTLNVIRHWNQMFQFLLSLHLLIISPVALLMHTISLVLAIQFTVCIVEHVSYNLKYIYFSNCRILNFISFWKPFIGATIGYLHIEKSLFFKQIHHLIIQEQLNYSYSIQCIPKPAFII